MRTLVACPYAPQEIGGVERYTKRICERLATEHGHEVKVCCVESPGDTESGPGDVPYDVEVLSSLFKVSSTPVGLWRSHLEGVASGWQPDVSIGHMPVPIFADAWARVASDRDIPYVLTYHNDITTGGLFAPARELYYRLVFPRTVRTADAIIVTSQAYGDSSPRLEGHRSKLRVVPPGLDPVQDPPQGIDDISADEGLVVFVGRLASEARHKGLDDLIRAFSQVSERIPQARLWVIGDGPRRGHYETLVERSGLDGTVTFQGFVTDDDLDEAYRRATVAVLPSKSRAEGFGMVLLEAQARGTPVIAGDIGGMPNALAPGKSGFLVEPGDVDDIADKLVQLLSEPEMSRKMGWEGVQFAGQFTWDRSAALTDEILREVVS